MTHSCWKDFRETELRLINQLWEWCWTCIIMLVLSSAFCCEVFCEEIGFFKFVGDGQTISSCEVRQSLSWCRYSSNRLRFSPPCAASLTETLEVLLLFPKKFSFCVGKSSLAMVAYIFVIFPSATRSNSLCYPEKSVLLPWSFMKLTRSPSFVFFFALIVILRTARCLHSVPRLHQPVQFLGSPQGERHSEGLSVLHPRHYDQSQGE